MSQFAGIIRRAWWLIVFLAIAVGAIAFVVSQLLPKEYDSRARVLVGGLTNTNHDTLLAFQQLAQTYAELATSGPVVERVASKLGLTEDPKDLAKRITADVPLGTVIVRIDATDSSPDAAARIANQVADEITIFATPQGESSLATLAEPALPAESPSSPRIVLNTAVAVALGAGIGVGLALLRDGSRRARPAQSQTEQADAGASRNGPAPYEGADDAREATELARASRRPPSDEDPS